MVWQGRGSTKLLPKVPQRSPLPQIQRREQRPEIDDKAARCRIEDRGGNDDEQQSSDERPDNAPLPPVERGGPMPAPHNEADQLKPIGWGFGRMPRAKKPW